jgi:hypothetical protein
MLVDQARRFPAPRPFFSTSFVMDRTWLLNEEAVGSSSEEVPTLVDQILDLLVKSTGLSDSIDMSASRVIVMVCVEQFMKTNDIKVPMEFGPKKRKTESSVDAKIMQSKDELDTALVMIRQYQQHGLAVHTEQYINRMIAEMEQLPDKYFTVMITRMDLQSLKRLQDCITNNREDSRMTALSRSTFHDIFTAIDQNTKIGKLCEDLAISFCTLAFLREFRTVSQINWEAFRKAVNDRIDDVVAATAVAAAAARG